MLVSIFEPVKPSPCTTAFRVWIIRPCADRSKVGEEEERTRVNENLCSPFSYRRSSLLPCKTTSAKVLCVASYLNDRKGKVEELSIEIGCRTDRKKNKLYDIRIVGEGDVVMCDDTNGDRFDAFWLWQVQDQRAAEDRVV